MKKLVASVGVAVALTAGSVAVAAPAHAYTVSEYIVYHGGNLCEMRGYVNYNWWEESWMGGSYRDYTYHKYYYHCPVGGMVIY